jgi:N-acetylmuramoyl-L-alanine amidase
MDAGGPDDPNAAEERRVKQDDLSGSGTASRTARALSILLPFASLLLAAPRSGADGEKDRVAIVDRPIRLDEERRELTIEYLRRHYGIASKDAKIVPRAVVVHWTGTMGIEGTWRAFDRVRLRTSRRHLLRGGALNVSAHFLVDRDGTIYRLLPEEFMARHCIGLNYDAIGIENVGGGPRWPLTDLQVEANARLIQYLHGKYPIRYLLGHMEWKRFENSPLFRELDPTYRNSKDDPGVSFMRKLRARLRHLGLWDSYKAAD